MRHNYPWERFLVETLSRPLGHRILAHKVANVVLGGIEVATWLGAVLILLITQEWLTAILGAAGVTVIVLTDDRLKAVANRDRPDGSGQGFPSGDVALATFWATVALGPISGLLIGTFTGVCRMVLRKHWPLDVVGGMGVGSWVAIPILVIQTWA